MPSLQIRDMPDDVYQALASRAGRARRSLAQQAVVELREAMGIAGGRQRILGRIRERLAEGGARDLRSEPEALVRADRDR